MSSKITAEHFQHLDIWSEVERHTFTRLTPFRSGKQASGACPFDDCSVDTDGFTVWPELTDKGRHYYCRGCRRSGNIIDLLEQIKGYTFNQACAVLDIDNPYIKQDGTAPQTEKNREKPRKVLSITPSQDCLILRELYPRARLALQNPRAWAYLAARGIPFELAQELGYGYIPEFEPNGKYQAIKKWSDRIIVPLTSSSGQGFIGRALHLWCEGMDENKHKEALKAAGVNRYEKTYPAGYFHAEALEMGEYLTIVEGLFDATALLVAGIQDVMATCGTSIDTTAIPSRICNITIAYDSDAEGQRAAEDLSKKLRRIGITPRLIVPPADDKGKDWSERFRLHGREGLAVLTQDDDLHCKVCGAEVEYYSPDGIPYCAEHYQALQVPA